LPVERSTSISNSTSISKDTSFRYRFILYDNSKNRHPEHVEGQTVKNSHPFQGGVPKGRGGFYPKPVKTSTNTVYTILYTAPQKLELPTSNFPPTVYRTLHTSKPSNPISFFQLFTR